MAMIIAAAIKPLHPIIPVGRGPRNGSNGESNKIKANEEVLYITLYTNTPGMQLCVLIHKKDERVPVAMLNMYVAIIPI